MANSRALLEAHLQEMLRIMQELDLLVNWEKSSLTLSQLLSYLSPH